MLTVFGKLKHLKFSMSARVFRYSANLLKMQERGSCKKLAGVWESIFSIKTKTKMLITRLYSWFLFGLKSRQFCEKKYQCHKFWLNILPPVPKMRLLSIFQIIYIRVKRYCIVHRCFKLKSLIQKMHFSQNSPTFPGFSAASSGWLDPYLLQPPYLGFEPGSRRDPAPYIYSHKFAQLSPRSHTAPLFISFKEKHDT